MINVEFEPTSRSALERALSQLGADAPKAMSKAINDTAKTARKDLANKARETYDVKNKSFNSEMSIRNATQAKLEAIIKASGEALQLSDFKVSPATPRNGNNRPSYVKGRVLKHSSMNNLMFNGRKAFVISVGKGHNAVVARKVDHESKSDRKHNKRHTHTFYSPSVPVMLGSEKRVYGIVEPSIQSNLQKNLEAQIKKLL